MTGRRIHPADVSAFAREVVAQRALVLIAVAGVCHLAVEIGLTPGDWSARAERITTAAIDAMAAVGAIFWIRAGTTPADPALRPRSSNGRPLVEAEPSPPAQHPRM